eukprot:EG_transcript_2213
MRPPKPRRAPAPRVATMVPAGPMTVMPQFHPNPTGNPAGPPPKKAGVVRSVMTVMPGAPKPTPTASPAAFFASSSTASSESQMWEEQRRRDALQAAAAAMDEDEAQQVCRPAEAFVRRVSRHLPAAQRADFLGMAQSPATLPRLMEHLHDQLHAGHLTPLYSDPEALDAALALIEALAAHRRLTVAALRFFEGVVGHAAFPFQTAVVFDADRPLPRLLLQALAADQIPEEDVRQAVRSALLCVYRRYPPLREELYGHLLRDLRAFGYGQNTCHAPVHDLLYLLLPVLSGLRTPVAKQYECVLSDVLAPLHSPSFMLDELTPVLQTYHKPLSLCTRVFMRKLDPDRHFRLASTFMKRVLNCWQPTNTKHTVLLLNALQDILEEIDGEVFDAMHPQICKLLADSSSSEHAAVAQRALQLWRSEAVVCLMRRQAGAVIPDLVPALVRQGQPHWNDGVNNLIGIVIELLEALTDDSKQLLHTCAAQYMADTGLCSSAAVGEGAFRGFVAAVNQRREQRQRAEQECTELKQQRSEEHRRRQLPETVTGHLNFVWGRDLGYGSYSVVRYAKFIEREVPQSLWLEFALKVMNKAHIAQQRYEAQVAQEIAVLRAADHPAVSRLYAHFEDATSIYAVLEYCTQGDLFSIIFESNSAVNMEWFKFCMAEVANVLAYLHQLGYYYGDLKPENILMTETGHLRLCDFGSCKSRAQLQAINAELAGSATPAEVVWAHVSGTAEYLAPEVIGGKCVGVAADWWAMGCLAFQLLAGHLPFLAESREELFAKVLRRDFRFPNLLGAQLQVQEVIDGLLHPLPDRRYDFHALKAHVFFVGVPFDNPFDVKSPPVLNLKRGSGDEVDSKWKRRKYSMMWNPIPSATSAESLQASLLDAIPEVDPEQMQWEYYGVRP